MMMLKRVTGCLLLVVFLAVSIQADESTHAFLDGVERYKNEDYGAAITEFSKIADAGVRSGTLFYNIGNACLKSGDIGHAMLWYERALRLMPNDPDLKFNHEYALTLVKDEKEDNRWPVLRVLFFWQRILSASTVQWTALILNSGFWLILALRTLQRKNKLKLPGYIILIFTLVFSLTAAYNYYASQYIKQGVILADRVSVRSGLTDDSTELFLLHAGTKVKIEKENKAYYKIYFSAGKIGWLKKSDVGII